MSDGIDSGVQNDHSEDGSWDYLWVVQLEKSTIPKHPKSN